MKTIKKAWAFDLRRGPINSDNPSKVSDMVWRADSWLHYNCAGGMASILMTEKNCLEFAKFLEGVAENPNGFEFKTSNSKLRFDSENHDGLGFDKSVNVLIGGQSFVTIFNIPVSNLLRFAEYMKQNAKVG